MDDATEAARRLIEDHKLYFEDSHDERCKDTITVARALLAGAEREAALMEPIVVDEAGAIDTYQRQHATCDIQQHPWHAVFGAGFAAGLRAALAVAAAPPSPATARQEGNES